MTEHTVSGDAAATPEEGASGGIPFLRYAAVPPEYFKPSYIPTDRMRRVLGALYLCRNVKTGRCDPPVSVIALDVEMDERNVQRTLRELEKSGIISIVQRAYTSSYYIINDPSLWKKHALKKETNFVKRRLP